MDTLDGISNDVKTEIAKKTSKMASNVTLSGNSVPQAVPGETLLKGMTAPPSPQEWANGHPRRHQQ